MPAAHAERAAVLESVFGAGEGVLGDLLALKAKPRKLRAGEIDDYFRRLDRLLDSALNWMEAKWPLPLSA